MRLLNLETDLGLKVGFVNGERVHIPEKKQSCCHDLCFALHDDAVVVCSFSSVQMS